METETEDWEIFVTIYYEAMLLKWKREEKNVY